MLRAGHKMRCDQAPSPASGDGVSTGAVFNVNELPAHPKLPMRTIYSLAREGSVTGEAVGRHRRLLRGTIDSWLRSGDAVP